MSSNIFELATLVGKLPFNIKKPSWSKTSKIVVTEINEKEKKASGFFWGQDIKQNPHEIKNAQFQMWVLI